MLTSLADPFYAVLGNWWAFGILFVASGIMFGYLVPRAQKAIFAHVTTDLPHKVLDVHVMSWTPAEARRLLAEIGPEGRRAYRKFYLYLDFWFPTLITSLLYCSFLALAFPRGSLFAWLVPLGMLGWFFDAAEAIMHQQTVCRAREVTRAVNSRIVRGAPPTPALNACKYGIPAGCFGTDWWSPRNR